MNSDHEPSGTLDPVRSPPPAPTRNHCRGPYCVLAPDAVEQLHRAGRSVRRLEVGFPEWRLAGLPTETPRAS